MSSFNHSIRQVSLNSVKLTDKFWAPRIKINHYITIPHVLKKCEKTGRIENFSRAAGVLNDGKKPIFPFDDSDVFKVIEGAAYSLIYYPDPKFEKYLDNLIEKIAAAQEDDGYLYTTRTINPENPHKWAGKDRWELVSILSHELYNMGHLIEAGIAYYQVTGKEKLLNVVIKSADLIDREFGQEKLERIPGHQEIELALIRLYNITKDKKYSDLAKFFLDIRGSTEAFDFEDYLSKFKIYFEDARSPEYNQSHKKIIEQDEAVGHAVRATYMYSAVTDIISIFNETEYKKAISRIWENMVSKKLYLTGGIGASKEGESFGENYKLPNLKAYAETCAAIGNIFWNHRLFLLYEDAKYIDVLERILYNGFLSGISLDGTKFFYINPLASKGNVYRRSWWKCPCCPTNIIRFMPQIPSFIYALKDKTIFVNLFIGSMVQIVIENIIISITQETDYPWKGKVKIIINPSHKREFELAIRIPGWAQNKPVPSDLYHYLNPTDLKIKFKVNNKDFDVHPKKGFIKIRRIWKDNDTIELNIPMPIRRVLSHDKVEDDVDKFAIERGPIVYCLETIDNEIDSIFNLVYDDSVELIAEFRRDILKGVVTITGNLCYVQDSKIESFTSKNKQIFIPYYAWANRGKSEMIVWVTRKSG
ncbi:MAG: glycoside hydrolase family 127 protein [Promethearchaeota archaeon]